MPSILEDRGFINTFQSEILNWGRKNIKEYPWRFSSNPYKILVSELMLMRTRADQVIPVFFNFIENYPDIQSLRSGAEEDLYRILYPLGLNWRIRNMVRILREIPYIFNDFPKTYEDLISIDGIGPYIAGATICFSTNEPVVLIDTNIVKVIGRVCGLNLEGEARRRKEMYNAIHMVVPKINPALFYYSLIDLSHSICLNKNPECQICPLKNLPCVFYKNKG